MFGGLINSSAQNDLYSFSSQDPSFSLVRTTGDVPSERVGHASALISAITIVWGGGTHVEERGESLDDGLYLLNSGVLM